MKALFGPLLCVLFLTSCSSNSYQYQSQANPSQWKGRSINDLQKQWGMPDQTIDARDGSGVYLYASKSTADFFRSTTTNFGPGDTGSGMIGQYNDASLMCYTVFQTNPQGIITSVTRKGNNCGGEWVPRKSS